MQRSETSLYINTKRGQYYPKNKQYGVEWPLLYPFEQAVMSSTFFFVSISPAVNKRIKERVQKNALKNRSATNLTAFHRNSWVAHRQF